MGNCCSWVSPNFSHPPAAADIAHVSRPPLASGVVPALGAAKPDGGVMGSQPPDPSVAMPVGTSPRDRETMPPPGSPPHTGEKLTSPPSRPRGQDLQFSLSMGRGTMTMTRQRQIDSRADGSTADGSARAGTATRSNSAFSSFQLATLVSPPPQIGIRTDKSSREPQARPRRAATDPPHYQRTSRTYQTLKDDKKPQQLTSTVRELLPDNFRYGFGCPLINYIS
jgi:hypothetical protein